MTSLIFGTIGAKTLELLERWGYGGAFVLSILDRVTVSLIPSEILLPLYGILLGQGVFSIWVIFTIISIGALIGEVLLYWIFAKGGRPFLEKYGKYFLVYKHDLDHLDKLFTKHGQKFVFWGRFFPVARAIVAIPAGISRWDVRKFAVYTFFGMMPYNLLFIFLGQKTGENLEYFKKYLDVGEKIILGVLLAIVIRYVYRHLKRKHASH